MADETDFLDLYRKLRLEPGCSLEDFKQAYRRHVSLWHPDRRRGSRADALAATRLQRLTGQYGAAMDFYRRHGRLPGAPMVARTPEACVEAEEAIDRPKVEPLAAAATSSRAPARGLKTRWWLVILAVCVGATAWSMWPSGHEFDENAAREVAVPSHDDEKPMQGTLSLGMSEEEVLVIEGEPTRRGAERWEYGPSWVRFEQGAVADWYSSPLRSLRVDSSKPRP